MRAADAAKNASRTLAICGLATALVGAARRPRPAFEDKTPEVKAARLGARELLGRPECQAVLTDFESVNGGRLDLVLRSTGRTAQEQLDRMVLESGLGRPGCAGPVLASMQIGSSAAYICLRPFALLRPAEREAVLIHEMLHSLGLRENPPTSGAITAQVMARCGR